MGRSHLPNPTHTTPRASLIDKVDIRRLSSLGY